MRDIASRKSQHECTNYWCHIKGKSYPILYFTRIVLNIIDAGDFFLCSHIREILAPILNNASEPLLRSIFVNSVEKIHVRYLDVYFHQ